MYRVTYPGLMQNLVRYFDNEAAAAAFAAERRRLEPHSGRPVKVEKMDKSHD